MENKDAMLDLIMLDVYELCEELDANIESIERDVKYIKKGIENLKELATWLDPNTDGGKQHNGFVPNEDERQVKEKCKNYKEGECEKEPCPDCVLAEAHE